jgi:hypothetical protein
MQMGSHVRDMLPTMELESFAWMQLSIVSYYIEVAQHSPHINVEHEPKHKYTDTFGLRDAIKTCMTAIGWEPSPASTISTVFAIPRQTVVQAPGRLTQTGLLGEDFTEFRKRNENLDMWGRSLESFFDEDRVENAPAIVGPLLKQLEDYHRSRGGNLFTTAGGYVGANLCRILPGDEIFILFGCRMPVVLRRVEGAYRLIGSVYVCGIMDGEAMDELTSGGNPPEEVVIM